MSARLSMSWLPASAAVIGLSVAAVSASPTILPSDPDTHADIGIAYDPDAGEWDLHVHKEQPAPDEEFEPDEVIFLVPNQAALERVGGYAAPEFDFLGVGVGETFWMLPAIQESELLYLGIGSEEMDGTTFDSYLETDPRVNLTGRWIKLQLVDVRGPGHFSAWTDGPTPTVWWSSFDALDATDAVWNLEGGHDHYSFAFSLPGLYEVDFVASAYIDGDLVASEPTTYTFAVVPEPASGAVLALGGLLLGRRRRN